MNSRRTMSQIVMWLILAGTVSLAAIVDQRVERANRVELTPPMTRSGVVFTLPKGWEASQPDNQMAIACVQEPADPHRVLTIYAQRLHRSMSVSEYLQAKFLDEQVTWVRPRPVEFGNARGLLIRGVYDEQTLVMLACAILPNGEAVTVRIDGGEVNSNTEKLIRAIAGTIRSEIRGEAI